MTDAEKRQTASRGTQPAHDTSQATEPVLGHCDEAAVRRVGVDLVLEPCDFIGDVWLLTTWRWTDSLPINAYVIDHEDGLILFDTGQDRAAVTDPA